MEMALCLELGGQDSNLKFFHFLHGFFASSQPNLSFVIGVQTNVANRAAHNSHSRKHEWKTNLKHRKEKKEYFSYTLYKRYILYIKIHIYFKNRTHKSTMLSIIEDE